MPPKLTSLPFPLSFDDITSSSPSYAWTLRGHRGPWSDAECLLRWHSVPSPRPFHSDDGDEDSDGDGPCSLINPHNRVQLALPAVAREHDDLYFGLDRNQEWRTLMR